MEREVESLPTDQVNIWWLVEEGGQGAGEEGGVQGGGVGEE